MFRLLCMMWCSRVDSLRNWFVISGKRGLKKAMITFCYYFTVRKLQAGFKLPEELGRVLEGEGKSEGNIKGLLYVASYYLNPTAKEQNKNQPKSPRTSTQFLYLFYPRHSALGR